MVCYFAAVTAGGSLVEDELLIQNYEGGVLLICMVVVSLSVLSMLIINCVNDKGSESETEKKEGKNTKDIEAPDDCSCFGGGCGDDGSGGDAGCGGCCGGAGCGGGCGGGG